MDASEEVEIVDIKEADWYDYYKCRERRVRHSSNQSKKSAKKNKHISTSSTGYRFPKSLRSSSFSKVLSRNRKFGSEGNRNFYTPRFDKNKQSCF